jgi:hypothetical protein
MLTLAASTSNRFEAEAAERAARRLVESCKIDPTWVPNESFVSRMSLADSELLKKLREEYHARHLHLKPCAAPGCDRLFDPVRSRRRFCSDTCRQKAYRERR